MSALIFTRRHYVAIAELIRDAGYLEPEARGQLVSDFAELFGSDNERFSVGRFRAAAYNGAKLDEAAESVPRCTTCDRPADEGYVNERAGERCVDAVHDPYSPAGAALKGARRAWQKTSAQLELVQPQ